MECNLENFPDRGAEKYWKTQDFDYTTFVHDVYFWIDRFKKELREKLLSFESKRWKSGSGFYGRRDATKIVKEILGETDG